MPNQSRGLGGRNGDKRGSQGRGAARRTGANMNWSLAAVGEPFAPQGQSLEARQLSRERGIVRPQSASPQTRQMHKRQTNGEAGPSERRPRVMIRGNQLFVGRTGLNPKILQHPLMALRSVMPLRTIVDQILIERWRAQQPIVWASWDCDYTVAPYRRGKGCCGEPTKVFRSRRLVRIHYNKGFSNTEWYAAFVRHTYDKNEAAVGEGYQVSSDSFDPSESTSSSTKRYREQREIDNFGNSIPTRPHEYMSDEDISSNSGNGFKNLTRD